MSTDSTLIARPDTDQPDAAAELLELQLQAAREDAARRARERRERLARETEERAARFRRRP
ncbi:MAG TPA: hypothetical protein VD860_00795 [Azospirillum sp.]|nr:hypothetical protein [Azospirillum sp.]